MQNVLKSSVTAILISIPSVGEKRHFNIVFFDTKCDSVGDQKGRTFGDNHKVKLGKKTLENQRYQAGQDGVRFVGFPTNKESRSGQP